MNESTTTASASSGSAFSYDVTSGTYQYDWKTNKSQAGSVWSVGARLDDGSTQLVSIRLR